MHMCTGGDERFYDVLLNTVCVAVHRRETTFRFKRGRSQQKVAEAAEIFLFKIIEISFVIIGVRSTTVGPHALHRLKKLA